MNIIGDRELSGINRLNVVGKIFYVIRLLRRNGRQKGYKLITGMQLISWSDLYLWNLA